METDMKVAELQKNMGPSKLLIILYTKKFNQTQEIQIGGRNRSTFFL